MPDSLNELGQLNEEILRRLHRLSEPKDLAPLIERLSTSKIVMLGEASHGTYEFYEWRRIISEWLVVKHGFEVIAVEGDWPPAMRVSDYIRGLVRKGRAHAPQIPHIKDARDALQGFHRWPTWMWANTEMVRFVDWMRTFNHRHSLDGRSVDFIGLDVYSFFESMDQVIARLNDLDPKLARRARDHYACFDRFARDERRYAQAIAQLLEGCEQEVIQALEISLRLRIEDFLDSSESTDIWDAQQNARIVKSAEAYYRMLIRGTGNSWNVRDEHMLDTLERVLEKKSKVIVWAHNTHIGDHRATDMMKDGSVNLGGLARMKFGQENVALVGFGTYEGTVIASHAWDGPIEKFIVPEAHPESFDAAFHRALTSSKPGLSAGYLILDPESRRGPLGEWKTQRAIGVVYQPRFERFGNYVPTSLARRYDAFVFIDQTQALEPLNLDVDHRELPETWPSGA